MPTTDELIAELRTDVRAATAAFEGGMKAFTDQTESQEKRMGTNRILSRLAIIAAVIGVAVGTGGLAYSLATHTTAVEAHNAARLAQDISAQQKADRAEAQIASCLQDRARTARDRAHAHNSVVQAIDAFAPKPRPDDVQARALAWLAATDMQAAHDYPFRLCTPQGIANYLKVTAGPTTTVPLLEP